MYPGSFGQVFAILLVLIISSFLTNGENQKVFLELTKYVTGAVIGSLFGNNVRNERDNTQGERKRDNHGLAPNNSVERDAAKKRGENRHAYALRVGEVGVRTRPSTRVPSAASLRVIRDSPSPLVSGARRWDTSGALAQPSGGGAG